MDFMIYKLGSIIFLIILLNSLSLRKQNIKTDWIESFINL
jgi:hypothetical protein